MTSFRAVTGLFVVNWVTAGIVFVASHRGVGDLGPTLTSLLLYPLWWRCANCHASFGSTVKLELSKEELRARRDPVQSLATAMTALTAIWETVVILVTWGSESWLTDAAMLSVIPVVVVIAFARLRADDASREPGA